MKAETEITNYSIGPFNVDAKANTITLTPGEYVFREPVVFGITKDTRIEGAECNPLPTER